MARSAARISRKLLTELIRLDDGKMPIAEVARNVGSAAERLGEPRPSYERVRTLVQEARRVRKRATGEVVLDVMLRAEPFEALLDHLAGTNTRYK